LARENTAAVDPALVAKLQQAANLANENCDRATALAHTLSAELREAYFRINQLEADGLVERLRAEAETAVAKLQSDANARVELTRREADARIVLVDAEAESRVRHLQGELAQAQQLADRAKGEAQIAHDRIVRAETEANERLSRAWAEIEDQVIRLKADLAQAELRAERAEQWLVLVRREIEDNLIPSFATMHERVTGRDPSRAVPPAREERDNAQPTSTFFVASDGAAKSSL
jgi:predicted  nucleic acid-binding Zn-ribbon protein